MWKWHISKRLVEHLRIDVGDIRGNWIKTRDFGETRLRGRNTKDPKLTSEGTYTCKICNVDKRFYVLSILGTSGDLWLDVLQENVEDFLSQLKMCLTPCNICIYNMYMYKGTKTFHTNFQCLCYPVLIIIDVTTTLSLPYSYNHLP